MTKETIVDVAGTGTSKKRVLIIGPILTQTGYGEHARFMWRALKSRPDLFDVFVSAINWGNSGWLWENNEERRQIDDDIGRTQWWAQQGGTFDITLMVTIPQEWPDYRAAPKNIGVTAGIETNKISERWIKSCPAADKILFTSNFSKTVFEEAVVVEENPETGEKNVHKVGVPMEVINYPVKEYEKKDLDLKITTDFNFLTVAQWGPRKNIENTIKWFVEEFIDQEVGLVLKLQMTNGGQRDKAFTRETIEKILKEYPERKCKVYLLHGYISDAEMHSLYTHPKISALISLSHGEGFGLPLFEAAYSGLPVLTHDWGGQTDFLYAPKKNKKGKVSKRPFFAKIDYDLSLIQPSVVWKDVLEEDSQWAYPKQGSCKMKFRDVYKNYNRYKNQATKLKEYLNENFSKEKQYEKVIEAICDKEYMEMTKWFEELSEEIVEVA